MISLQKYNIIHNIIIYISDMAYRGLIQGGVNVACSRKKKALRNVRVSKRSGPVQPVRLHECTKLSNVTPLCLG